MGKMGTGEKTAHRDCGLEGGKNRASALSIDFAQGKKSLDTPCLLAISKPGQGDRTSSSVLSLNNCICFGGTSFQEKVSSLGFCSDSFLSLGNLSESHLINGYNWTTCFVAHFYWSINDLQYCVAFRCTTKWYMGSFSLWFITEYWIKFPMLYSKSLLSTLYLYASLYICIYIFFIYIHI